MLGLLLGCCGGADWTVASGASGGMCFCWISLLVYADLQYCLLCCCVQGGNDFEIFTSEKTVGHTVTSPDDTQKQCTDLFIKQAVTV